MKRLFPIFLIATMLLSACGVLTSPPANPTPSDEQLATRVAQILTAMPSPTLGVQAPTAVPPTAVPPTGTVAPSPTAVPPADTATPVPTAVPTNTPVTPQAVVTDTTGQVGGGGPSIDETPQAGGGAPVEQATQAQSGGGAPPTPTAPPTVAVPSSDISRKLGPPAFTDPMDNGNNWPTGVDLAGFTSIAFQDGQMLLTGLQTRSGWRLSRYGTNLGDFYIEMRVSTTTCTGNDRYGIYFRVPNKFKPDQGYWYGLTCDGRYALQQWDGEASAAGTVTNLIYWTKSSAINAGSNATNRMGVMAIGRHIWLFINGQLVAQKDSSTWLQGAFGVFVGARETQNMVIKVDQIDVWTNPVAP